MGTGYHPIDRDAINIRKLRAGFNSRATFVLLTASIALDVENRLCTTLQIPFRLHHLDELARIRITGAGILLFTIR